MSAALFAPTSTDCKGVPSRSGGMACHLVQHHIVTGGTGRDYRLTWCRTSSGEWKTKA
jgi:hypothetical protein